MYDVVRIDPTTGGVPSYLVPLLGDGGISTTGWLCTAAARQIGQQTDGFTAITLPNHSCGAAETFGG